MRLFVVSLLLTMVTSRAFAYGKPSHSDFAEKSIETISINTNSTTNFNSFHRDTFGINTNELYYYIGLSETGIQWISKGAEDEDNGIRPFNHFYDPQHDDSLWSGINRRYGLPSSVFEVLGESNITPDWALEDRETFSSQKYSLKDTHDYLYKALTAPTDFYPYQGERNSYVAQYFYALGHVLHLLADMGQPEHVRIDQHMVFGDPEPIWIDKILRSYSLYEKYTDTERRRLMQELPQLAQRSSTPYPYRPDNIRKARHLWIDRFSSITTESGLSVFTNNNFVSTDTNFDTDYYQKPLYQEGETCEPLSNLLNGSGTAPIDPRIGLLTGTVCFVSSHVTDRNKGNISAINQRASSLSIFNNEVTKYHDECLIETSYFETSMVLVDDCKRHTLNRWNFDSAHAFLMPRIVGYSSALLEHLYRGRMDVQRPDAASLDKLHFDPRTGDMVQLPIAVKNTTPSGEAMPGGTLIAVVSYIDDNGDIVKSIRSNELANVSPSQSSHNTYTFRFEYRATDGSMIYTPAPLNITGTRAYIKVIYRGGLGEESDNIVVAREPLSELITPINIDIGVPAEGVYALADHQPQNAGFSHLKIKLSSPETLDGIITPIITYHLNNCYTDDLQGEFNVGGQKTRLCPSPSYRSEESYSIPIEIAETASGTIQASSLNASGTEFTFNLSTPIPFNATDLKIEYYHFPSDPAAPIGVGVSDISEPTYIAAINNTDYYSISGTYYSIEEMLAGNMAAYVEETKIYPTAIDLTIKTNSIPAATISGLPAGGYARFAVLTSPNESTAAPFTLEMEGTGTNFRPRFASGINAAIAQLDSSTNTIRYSYLPTFRGVTAHYPIYFEQTRLGLVDGDPSTMPVIEAANQTAATVLQP